jgi:signal transduction histidine kinase
LIQRANEELEARVEQRTRQLSEMSQLRQELLRKVVTAQEEERGRISRDLHDDTGQTVTALLLGLENLKNAVGGTSGSDLAVTDVVERFSYLQSLAGEVAQKSHQLSFTLRPTDLDDIGLVGALHNYADQWSRWSGLPVDVESVGLEESGERLSPEVETTIYRVVQEALTNVLRHAVRQTDSTGERLWASRVSVLVQMRRRGSDGSSREVITTVEDDGPGFDVERAQSLPAGKRRLGLFGMQERARLAGGTLTVESEPGAGTTVYLRLPLIPQEL